nr:hypothetical protein BHI3_04670 [Bacteriovorax sp. HI3]
MKTLLLAFSLLFMNSQAFGEEENRLNPFESDGCSMVPDSEPFSNNDWLNCCIPHDINYWKGGTAEEKEKTDMAFKACLEKNKMGKWLSTIFYYGVSLGGTPKIKTTWRWGYGWEKSRSFSPLSKKDLKKINEYKDLFKLPVYVRSQELVEAIVDAFTTRNTCKDDMRKRIEKHMTFKTPVKEFKMHRIEGGDDRYQIFSPECKAGYMVVDFHPHPFAPDLCVFSDYYYYQVERIKSFLVYGDCQNFLKNK